MASSNRRGTNKVGVREEVQKWMKTKSSGRVCECVSVLCVADFKPSFRSCAFSAAQLALDGARFAMVFPAASVVLDSTSIFCIECV